MSVGQWHWDQNRYTDWGIIRNEAGHVVAQAKVPEGTDEKAARLSMEDPCKERALLIAAAPELLEALKDVMSICKGYLKRGQDDNIIYQAEAAIAKAEGGPQ